MGSGGNALLQVLAGTTIKRGEYGTVRLQIGVGYFEEKEEEDNKLLNLAALKKGGQLY